MTSPDPRHVRALLLLDASNVMRRLAERHEQMLAHFSRLRDRDALLLPLSSWGETARFADLVCLSVREQAAVSRFYERLGELRWYFRYTDDMPGTAQAVLRVHLKTLGEAHASLVKELEAPARRARPRDAQGRPPRGGVKRRRRP